MVNGIYKVVFRDPNMGAQFIAATNTQIHGKHLLFLDADHRLTALFVLEFLESWSLSDRETA